jgi:uncharacterized protein YbjQ (UPF0145 family)
MENGIPSLILITIQLGIPLAVIILALCTGTIVERRHYRSIHEREEQLGRVPMMNGRKYPGDRAIARSEFVTGSVVISHDHFKRFLAGLRKIFGGEIKAYVSLVDRGRREAILRLREKCPNADLIVNLRIDTSSIAKGKSKGLGTVEVFAYGTALWYE